MTLGSPTTLRLCACLAGYLALVAACGGGGGSSASGGGTPPANCQNPLPTVPASPRFSTDLLPMLQSTCGGGQNAASCHGTITVPAGKFSFYTGDGRTAQQVHTDLVNATPSNAPTGQGWMRIKPGDVSRSWLIEKVSSDQPGGLGYGFRMPLGNPPLCNASIDSLKTWVQTGAAF